MPTRIKWHGVEAAWDDDSRKWVMAGEPLLSRVLTLSGEGRDPSAYIVNEGNQQALHLRDALGVEILEQEGPHPDDKPGRIY